MALIIGVLHEARSTAPPAHSILIESPYITACPVGDESLRFTARSVQASHKTEESNDGSQRSARWLRSSTVRMERSRRYLLQNRTTPLTALARAAQNAVHRMNPPPATMNDSRRVARAGPYLIGTVRFAVHRMAGPAKISRGRSVLLSG